MVPFPRYLIIHVYDASAVTSPATDSCLFSPVSINPTYYKW
jgi:hypothetical protein